MALLPFTDLDTMLICSNRLIRSISLNHSNRSNRFKRTNLITNRDDRHHFRRSRRRTVKTSVCRMDREIGKLVSAIKEDDESFQVMVDVTDFTPDEITVKTNDKDIIVHAKHDEHKDPQLAERALYRVLKIAKKQIMSLMPYSDFHSRVDPFEPYDMFEPYGQQLQQFNPYAFGRNIMPQSMRRTMRHMDHELGKLLSSVKEDDKSFQVTVDVSHFDPSEITVKTTDNSIIVHGKHEERKDRFSTVSREFRRRVTIPQGVHPEQVTSSMSPDGVLTIMAPKMMLEGSKERVIPITMGPAGRPITNRSIPNQ